VPDIVRAVFGLGEPQYVWSRAAETPPRPQLPSRPVIVKLSGAPVRLEFFSAPEYPEISGVMFSPCPIWATPERWGDDLVFVHNPHARAPLPRATFRFGQEWWFDAELQTVNLRDDWS
jgi:hypothetical protein